MSISGPITIEVLCPAQHTSVTQVTPMPNISLTYDISTSPPDPYPLGIYEIHPTACTFTIDAVNVVYATTDTPVDASLLSADFTLSQLTIDRGGTNVGGYIPPITHNYYW